MNVLNFKKLYYHTQEKDVLFAILKALPISKQPNSPIGHFQTILFVFS